MSLADIDCRVVLSQAFFCRGIKVASLSNAGAECRHCRVIHATEASVNGVVDPETQISDKAKFGHAFCRRAELCPGSAAFKMPARPQAKSNFAYLSSGITSRS